jgi:GntR family transcriptional regulator/MocR family aminotransferase
MEMGTALGRDEARWWQLERMPGETLSAALERTVREAILSGTLRPGVRLPASRRLAVDLRISRGVVTDAYAQLIGQGFLVTQGRLAPVVADVPRPRAFPARTEPRPPRVRYDLTATTPDVSLFPLRRWLTTAGGSGRGVAAGALDYRDPGGERQLREALADHLGRTRGVIADPEQIVVTQGTSQGIGLLLRLLREQGLTRIAVEDPSHTGQHARIRAAGLELVGQRTDAQGLVTEGLSADAVLVTPAHQFPGGAVLSAERRRELLAWAKASEATLIEDDYDAELRYDRQPVRALQGLEPHRVFQLGTVSKTLVPALRLGWMVVPPAHLEAAIKQKEMADEFSPSLDQLTLAAFLRSGDYDRHVRKATAVYRSRRDRLVEALSTALPELAIAGAAGGLHVVLELPSWVDDAAIGAAAREDEIRVSPLSGFCVERTDARGLVIGYARLHESAAARVVGKLAATVRRHLQGGDGHGRSC